MDTSSEVLIPLGVMATFVALVAIVLYAQYRIRRLALDAVKDAVRNKEAVDPRLIEVIAREPVSRTSDLRRGVILLAVAAGFLVFGYAFGELTRADLGIAASGLGAFPGFVGLAYLALHLVERKRG